MSKKEIAAPVHKNQVIQLKIQDLGNQGEGIGRFQEFTIFVEGALPGEEVEVRIVRVCKNFAYGKLLQVVQASAERIIPSCALAGKCGGCQLAHLSYEGQLLYKQNKITQALRRIGGFDSIQVPPIKGMSGGQWQQYRNKAQFPVQEVNGRAEAGFYALRSHRMIAADSCLLQSEKANALVKAVMEFVRQQGLSVYCEETQQGLLRHILIRDGRATGQVSLCLVINGKRLPRASEWIDFVKEKEITSFSVNYNREKGNVILGKKTEILYGSQYIEDRIGDLRFFISPPSFYQVNPQQTRVLYETALEMAGLTGKETVIDAYCGIGTISLFLAQRARKVYGVEIVPEAIENAWYNAEQNKLDNVEFFCGKSEDVIPALFRERGIRPDVMVVDPPRSGCEESLLETILQMAPDRLVYVSCDPATLARDLNYLCHVHPEYELKKVQGVCMFPQTTHVETVCLLSREEK